MFSELDKNAIPEIGEIVHFHPDDETRCAAIIVETHPAERDESTQDVPTPNANLQVFYPNGKIAFLEDVEPVFRTPEDMNMVDPIDPTGKWSRRNEFVVNQPAEDEQVKGSNGNFHCGGLLSLALAALVFLSSGCAVSYNKDGFTAAFEPTAADIKAIKEISTK